MSETNNLNGSGTSTTFSVDTEQTSTYTDTIFQRIEPREVEQFYKSYHFWLLQRRIETFYTEVGVVQQAIIDNNTLMQQLHLSAIALASLAQLQASGVSDLGLLDRMLERGETWLDHTMQLLEHCEKLDVIRGDYTQWCEHALEGAYDWIASMDATDTINLLENEAETPAISDEQQTRLHTATEEQLLQKLMSNEEATQKMATLNSLFSETREIAPDAPNRKITQPLDQPEQPALDAPLPTRKITQPLDQVEQTTLDAPPPTRKITQPLDQVEALIETELPAEISISAEIEQIELANSTNDEIISQTETISSDESTPALPSLAERVQAKMDADTAAVSTREETIVALELLDDRQGVPETPEVQDNTAQTETMPALIIEQISEIDSEVDAERNLDSNTMPEISSKVTEEPQIEHSGQIDDMKHSAEVPEEEMQERTMQEVATIEADDAFKDADIYTVEAAIGSEEASDQTSTEVVGMRESPQESKKPQLQKVQRKGFWRLLSRLLVIILHR